MRPLFLAFILLVSFQFLLHRFKSQAEQRQPVFNKILKSTDYTFKLQMAEKYYLNKDYNHAQHPV